MPQRLQTQLSREHRQGFAIGTILLAVVLIAAIVSAIAIASRGSSQDANRESARLAAMTALNQATQIQQDLDRVGASGGNRTSLAMRDKINPAINYGWGLINNTVRCTTATNANCIAENVPTPPKSLLIAYNNPITGTLQDFTNQDYFLWHIGTTGNVPDNNRFSMITLTGLSRSACQQFNSVLQGTPPGTTIPSAPQFIARTDSLNSNNNLNISTVEWPILNRAGGCVAFNTDDGNPDNIFVLYYFLNQ